MDFQQNIEDIIRSYSSDLYRILYLYCKNSADCEDIMQNTFLKLMESDRTFESEEHLKNWLIRVAVNEARSLYRREKLHWEKLQQLAPMEQMVFAEEDHRELYECIRRLKADERLVLILHYYQNYSVEELAGLLHVSSGTIKSRLHRSRKKLGKILKEEEWDEE
jgi:RNA polymerase sigma-70 factor (ECF subfamily)